MISKASDHDAILEKQFLKGARRKKARDAKALSEPANRQDQFPAVREGTWNSSIQTSLFELREVSAYNQG
jgi:hypothetical protein